ncbi:GntR family transcriptional regulator [Shimazuella sp. AN120528]|uniref:GntR family transcriptional regulator n=1 Tax=Shimazuella soli TaxID=1892854 RepID=UPI001F117A30|nr:GntR family transcriptional regulator [Shimazuella soli]MCH5583867.1 GntR family transcriptional regulator [Shimazuella soli]
MEERKVGSFVFQIDLSQPLYEQILDQIRSSVARGEIGLGEKIPSVRELAISLKVNPNTVMRAYQELERDGLTEKRRGQGTFITTSKDSIASFKSELAERYCLEFVDKMKSLGYTEKDMIHWITHAKGVNK